MPFKTSSVCLTSKDCMSSVVKSILASIIDNTDVISSAILLISLLNLPLNCCRDCCGFS